MGWVFTKNPDESAEAVSVSEGDEFRVEEQDELKEFLLREWPEYSLVGVNDALAVVNTWDTEGGLEYFEILDIPDRNDFIHVKVLEHYSSGESSEVTYGKSDITKFIRENYISKI